MADESPPPSPTRVPVLPPVLVSYTAVSAMSRRTEQTGGSTPSRSNTNNTTDIDATYYNVQVTSAQTQGNHSNDPQGRAGSVQGHHSRTAQSVTNTVDSSSSSSSSASSSSSSDSEDGRHLALVPRTPGFHPFMMGLPPQGPYTNPFGMPPPGFGPPAHPAMMGQMGGAPPGFPHPAAIGGGGPGGDLPRLMPPEDMRLFTDQERATPKQLFVMEHPSLRQFVIFMAIMFLLALVALIITAVYFGRSVSPSWNI